MIIKFSEHDEPQCQLFPECLQAIYLRNSETNHDEYHYLYHSLVKATL